MNNGILHGARPSDTLPKGNFGGMPAEVVAMARQMGLTAEDMKQVNSMWKNMDDLAESDPDSYKKFTGDILAEGPPEKGGKPKTFIPEPSFVVKLKTKTDGGTGMKVSTLSGPMKFFLNMTSCEALEPPKDHQGRPVEKNERRGADGLEIPLLVGEVRNCEDHSGEHCLVVDSVFNPWVMENAEVNNTFKAQVIDLAVQWVEQETKYKFDKQWKTIKSKYKGGLGDDNTIPMPFPIDRAINQSSPIEERSATEVDPGSVKGGAHDVSSVGLSTPSPESLLRATMKSPGDRPGPNDTVGGIRMPGEARMPGVGGQAEDTTTTTRKPLIEEVKPKLKTKPAVKKGFLHSKEANAVSLYDEKGSSGDGQKEGSYSRLMSKCQVVDMSTMTPEQQKVAMEQHAAQNAPQPPPTPSNEAKKEKEVEAALAGFGSCLEKGFLEGKSLASGETKEEPRSQNRAADVLFEKFISEIDPDYADASKPLKDASDESMSALGDIARVLAGQPGVEASGLPPKMLQPLRGLDLEAPRKQANASTALNHKIDISTTPQGLQVAIIHVPVEPALASAVDLQVGASELRLIVPSHSHLSVPMPFRIDDSKTKAKYSKARSSLKITLTESAVM